MDYSVHSVYRRCGKRRCRCASGHLHGPYHILCTRRPNGHRVHVSLRTAFEIDYAQSLAASVKDQRQQQQEKHRQDHDLRRAVATTSREAAKTLDTALGWLGLYRHAGRIRERRDFPVEVRQRRRYAMLDAEWRAAFTFEEYQVLCRQVGAARRRACRLRLQFDETAVWQEVINGLRATRAAPKSRTTTN